MFTSHQTLFCKIALLTALVGSVSVSCRLFDQETATAPTTSGRAVYAADVKNLIIGDADNVGWGGQYIADNAYFMANIPIFGAMKVEYAVQGGGRFALFLETTAPTKLEIGLTETDGAAAILESVCVTYFEGGLFSSKPDNLEISSPHNATLYLRRLETGGTESWWPVDAAFAFGGKTETVCVVTDGIVQGAVVDGPFLRTTPPLTATATVVPAPPLTPSATPTPIGCQSKGYTRLIGCETEDSPRHVFEWDGAAWTDASTENGTKSGPEIHLKNWASSSITYCADWHGENTFGNVTVLLPGYAKLSWDSLGVKVCVYY